MKNNLIEVTYAAVLGKMLALARKRIGLAQKDLADLLGIGVSAWSKIESGGSSITQYQLSLAAKGLNTTVAKFAGLVEEAVDRLPDKGFAVVEAKRGRGTAAAVGATIGALGGTSASTSLVAAAGMATLVPVGGLFAAAAVAKGALLAAQSKNKGAVLEQAICSVVDIASLWENT